MAEPGSADKYTGLSDKDRKMMGMGAEGPSEAVSREEYAESYQYTPRELQGRELDSEATAARNERQREAKIKQLGEYYDSDTAVRVRDMQQEGASAEDINAYQTRRAANKEKYVAKETQSIMELWERQAREADIKQRIADMERDKPKNVDGALKAVDRLWDDIHQALTKQAFDHRNHKLPEESLVGKEWAEYVLQILNDLKDRLRFEGSYPRRMSDDLHRAWEGKRGALHSETDRQQWIGGWKDKIRTLMGAMSSDQGYYTETPKQEWERRVKRDKAIERLRAA